MAHRVIETLDQVKACATGTVVIDRAGDVMSASTSQPGMWLSIGDSHFYNTHWVGLPARVLLESWER